ncbi:MAG: hypothetical protein ABJE10_00695 [bacterium]
MREWPPFLPQREKVSGFNGGVYSTFRVALEVSRLILRDAAEIHW